MALEYFEQRERALLGDRFDTLYTPPAEKAARGVTVSALRCTPEQFAQLVDFPVRPSPFCAAGFCVDVPDFKPGKHPYHAAGVFYSQEPSASSAAPLLGVKPGMRVLDTCAAPGGKTSQLATALQGHGLLVANEFVASRAAILKQNLERMGVRNAVVLNEDTSRIAEALPEFFDRVLVDAPCSGEGMFRKEEEASRQHSEALVEQCAELGAQILDNAAAALAPGGVMVYSTCTFAPQEDEAQVAAFLARHPEFTLLPALEESPLVFGSEGEPNRLGEHSADTTLMRRIWPCQGGEGHFIARLQKAGEPRKLAPLGELTEEETAWLNPKPAKGKAKKGKPAPKGGKGQSTGDVLSSWQAFAAEYFPSLTEKPALVRGENILLPPAFPNLPLHILRAGVLAGSAQKGRFVPEHHLFTAYGADCTNQERLTLSDPRTLAYLKGEEIEAKTAQNGWCCVTVDGFALGGGKVSGGRVKNHYPKALRFV